MINFGPDFKHKQPLSASKIKTLTHCSARYYASYILKLPDKGNSGSQKGDVTHRILELLCQKRRKPLVDRIRAFQSCRPVRQIWYLVKKYSAEHKIFDEAEYDMINKFILTALNTEFFGPDGDVEIIIEKPFDFEVIREGVSYRARGFIDKLIFTSLPNRKKSVKIVDYKSSKKKFSKQEVDDNIQSQLYERAVRYMYPDCEVTTIDFLFLAFPQNPKMEFPVLGEDVMNGLETYLTHVQQIVDNFSEKNVGDNLGIQKYETKGLCGPAKSGWICPSQRPFDYWVITTSENPSEIVLSAFTEDELTPKLKSGQKIEKRSYGGCIWFYREDGTPRTLKQDY
jgi:hypothetical protein